MRARDTLLADQLRREERWARSLVPIYIPLRHGVTVLANLPCVISRKEAEKIAACMMALATTKQST